MVYEQNVRLPLKLLHALLGDFSFSFVKIGKRNEIFSYVHQKTGIYRLFGKVKTLYLIIVLFFSKYPPKIIFKPLVSRCTLFLLLILNFVSYFVISAIYCTFFTLYVTFILLFLSLSLLAALFLLKTLLFLRISFICFSFCAIILLII